MLLLELDDPQESSADVVSGFSHRTARPRSSAGTRTGSCRKPGVATMTASIAVASSASSNDAAVIAPGAFAAAAVARPLSGSTMATTSAPAMVEVMRRMWSLPMAPAPTTATRRLSVVLMAVLLG